MTDLEETVSAFFDAMQPLKKKILAFLIQFPPWLKIMEGMDYLRTLDSFLDKSFRYAIEVRHPSWFNDMAYHFLRDRNFCLVWSQQERLATPPVKTSDILYLRLIGDRSISEKDFGKIVKDKQKEITNWSNILKDFEKNEPELKMAIISANNHYAGFGPATAKLFFETIDRNGKDGIPSFPLSDYQPVPANEMAVEDIESFTDRKQAKTKQSFLSEFFKDE